MIDFQNNGAPSSFVALAETFEIPWILICDNDNAGKEYIEQIKSLGLANKESSNLIRPLPEDNADLEIFLVKNGFLDEYMQILKELGINLTKSPGDREFENEIVSKLRADKTHYIIKLIGKLRSASTDETKIPKFFANAINDVITKAG